MKNPPAVCREEKPAHKEHPERVVYGILWGLARIGEVVDKENNDEIDNVVEHKNLGHLLHDFGGVQNAWHKGLLTQKQCRFPKDEGTKEYNPNSQWTDLWGFAQIRDLTPARREEIGVAGESASRR